jgi:hypothetical protein
MKANGSKRRWILVTVLAAAAVVVLVTGVTYAWLITPPPLPQSLEQAMGTIGSARYERMPDYRKREYLEQTRRLMREMPQDERTQVMEDVRSNPELRQTMGRVMRGEMRRRATAFAKADSAERIRLLDEAIDTMGQWRNRGRRPDGAGGGRGDGAGRGDAEQRSDRRGRMRDRIQGMFEEGNPQDAALIGEFFRALRQRREERGLPSRR